MFKTKVSYSTEADPFKSGVEVAENAIKAGNVKLGMLFTNCDMNQSKVLEGVKSVFGGKPVIGCTSSGGIVTPDGFISGDNYAGMMAFSDEDLIVGVAGASASKNARETGKQLARDAITNAGIKRVPSYFFMIASPKEEEEYLKGIQDVIGTVPFFGGSAADNTVSGKWKMFVNDKVITDGCAVAFFYAKNEFKNMYTGAYNETKNVGVITKIDGKRTLVEIDNEPALKKYASWINVNPDELLGNNLLSASVLKPLGVKDPIGSITAVRHPMFGNKNYSMNIGNDLAVGTAVIGLETTQDGLIKSNSETLKALNAKMKSTPVGYFLVHCGGRKLGIGERVNEIYGEIVKAIGDKEFLMIFTFGEYGSNDHSASTCGGLSLSFAAFGE